MLTIMYMHTHIYVFVFSVCICEYRYRCVLRYRLEINTLGFFLSWAAGG